MHAGLTTSVADNNISDIELVERLLRRTPGSFDLFYRRHERLIYHCIRKRADASDVDDLCQSFFMRLVEQNYHALALWQRGRSLPIYLSVVVRNFVFDFYRTKGRRGKIMKEMEGTQPSEIEQAQTTMPADTGLELKQLRRSALGAWSLLEKRDKWLVCGRYRREFSNELMADRLNISAGALRVALSRAHARLLEILRQSAPEYFPESV